MAADSELHGPKLCDNDNNSRIMYEELLLVATEGAGLVFLEMAARC
jgi:hypothetical protein